MRKIISYFIRYHVAINIIIVAFFLFGIFGILSLKSSFFPLVDSKIINIQVKYPGASPLEIEEGIVLKIEDNLRGIEGIEQFSSVSRENNATIRVEIQTDENINVLIQEVKNAVDRVPGFPVGMEPVVVSKQTAIRPTINFSVSGTSIPLTTLKQITRNIENDLRSIEGITQVTIFGYPQEEIEIAVRERDLQAFDLTFAEVAQAVNQSNILVTGGNIKTQAEEYLIRATNRAYYANALDHLVVRANPNGSVVRLKDVAWVRDRFSETPNSSYFNGNLSVNVEVSNTNKEDLISSAAAVRDYVADYNNANQNIQLNVVRDWSVTLNQRTALLIKNAGIGVFLVILFLSLFLNARLAFWVAFGLPISFLGMFIFAPGAGVTINVLSLFGMIIVVGILVDDAIVIGENIFQHYEQGKPPVQAAIDGTMEVMPAVISAIATTIIAFATFFFIESRIGKFFSEVSTIVLLTLTVSLFEALVILPAHLAHSKALRKKIGENGNPGFINSFFGIFRKINRAGDHFMKYLRDKAYAPVLKFALIYKFFTFCIFLFFLILTVGSIGGGIIKRSLFPRIASDGISVTLTMPQGTNERITDSIIKSIEEKAWEVGHEYTKMQKDGQAVVQNIIRTIGPGGSIAALRINLLPGEERDFSALSITKSLREKVPPVTLAESLIFGSGSNFGGSPVSISLLSNNIAELKAAKNELKERLNQNTQLKDISDNDPEGIKEIKIELKEHAYALGLDLRSVMAQVRAAFFGMQAQRFQRGQDEIRVWVRYDRQGRTSLKNLDEMRIKTAQGQRVLFGEIARYQIKRGEVAINHLDGIREIRVEADLQNRATGTSEVLDDLKSGAVANVLAHYPTVRASFEGQNREAKRLARSASRTIPVILILIYAVIAFTFRSYSQPFLLLMMVPFSVVGVAWGHFFHGFAINALSWLGIIALVGIMVNDGLVLISKFNLLLKKGLPFEEALFEAGKSRFRAIFLTSLTTVAGLAPLLLETSRQAQFLKPMAISISYGICIATVLTLILLPLLLAAGNKSKVILKQGYTGKKVSREEVERAVKELEIKNHE